MGDTWPYGPPLHVTWQQAYDEVFNTIGDANEARIMAAIGTAESSLDLRVVNDTPATGDYSVGVWQINYYNGLYAGRARSFGTPAQLVAGGLRAQWAAAASILQSQGYTAWSTYNTGAYQKYLHGFVTGPTGPGPGSTDQFGAPPPAPAKDWSGYVAASAGHQRDSAGALLSRTRILRGI